MPGLYAAGEVTCTGVHGANRLASNSLLEALVFAKSAAETAKDADMPSAKPELVAPKAISEAESIRLRTALRHSMTEHVGIVRNFGGLREAETDLAGLLDEYESLPATPYSAHPLETRNLIVAASYTVSGALRRNRNVGLHYNEDLVP